MMACFPAVLIPVRPDESKEKGLVPICASASAVIENRKPEAAIAANNRLSIWDDPRWHMKPTKRLSSPVWDQMNEASSKRGAPYPFLASTIAD
jgi:hypothetical protein